MNFLSVGYCFLLGLLWTHGSTASNKLYFNGSSYVILQAPLNIKEQFSFTFRTCYEGGVLLHQNGANSSYFSIELDRTKVIINESTGSIDFTPSYLKLLWRTSLGTQGQINIGTKLDKNNLYNVLLTPGSFTSNLNGTLHLAGVSVSVPPDIFSIEQTGNVSVGGNYGGDFVGCIEGGTNFNLDNVFLDINTTQGCPLENNECKKPDCNPGLTGEYCQLNIDECSSLPCHHYSTCVDKINNFTCECGAGWEGRLCDVHIPQCNGTCQNGGICKETDNQNNYTCTCTSAYTGRNCEIEITPCSPPPCQNGGTCSKEGDSGYKCSCPPGFGGRECEKDLDECQSYPCTHGLCIDGVNNYTCNCTGSGYTGSLCDQDIDECQTFPCQNNGTCNNQKPGYFCQCLDGWVGKTCTENIDDCQSTPCQNGGNCTDLINDYNCTCSPGYTGKKCEEELKLCSVKNPCNQTTQECINLFNNYSCVCKPEYTGVNCETQINNCDSSPCVHGNCTDLDNDFNCTCMSGYTGKRCENETDECHPNPCQNNGICFDAFLNFTCNCSVGFNGSRCETNVDDCAGNLCKNGTCVDGINSYTCNCSENFYGEYCGTQLDPCHPDPCHNGSCSLDNSTAYGYNCSCFGGYNGTNCSVDINECEPDPCPFANQTCIDLVDGYYCACPSGYTGSNCSIEIMECSSNPCQNNGTCTDLIDGFVCTCPSGFSGSQCEINIDDCPSSCGNGTCIDGVNEYTCNCSTGFVNDGAGKICVDIDECEDQELYPCGIGDCYNTPGSFYCDCDEFVTGRLCDDDINECEINKQLCGEYGICINKIKQGYQCYCQSGYTGDHCEKEVDECRQGNDCKNGTCEDKVNGYTCNCFPGYKGIYCDQDIDECSFGYCKNGANCTDLINNYTCSCQPGYTDYNCSTNIDECLSNPCFNGTCNDAINGYTCECYPGYTGVHCEVDIDWCASTPCVNNATCLDGLLNYTCVCYEGYLGLVCEVDFPDCHPDPCVNGTCLEKSNMTDLAYSNRSGYICECDPGYIGTNCSIEIDECKEFKPCENGANCTDLINDYRCTCVPGYEGKNCSIDINECDSSPCQNNATCLDLIGGFNCSCPANYTGSRCEYDISPCSPINPCKNQGDCIIVQNYNFSCACANGFTGPTCEEITTMSFTDTSYIKLTTNATIFEISLRFQTTLPDGILLRGESTTNVFSIHLKSHSLLLSNGSVSIPLSAEVNLTNADWHSLRMIVTSGFLILQIDNGTCGSECYQNISIASSSVQYIFIGGFNSSYGRNFTGAIQDIIYQKQMILPVETAVVELVDIVVGSNRTEVCEPNPCLNGQCEDLWNTYNCYCSRPYTGSQCNEEIEAGTFGSSGKPLNTRSRRSLVDEQSYALFQTETSFIQNSSLSFFIKTRKSSGLIALLYSSNTSYLAVGLIQGQISMYYRSNGISEFIPTLGVPLNDGNRRLIEITPGTTTVDGANVLRVPIQHSLLFHFTFLGGVDNSGTVPSTDFSKAQFEGCIQDINLNGKEMKFDKSADSYLLINKTGVGSGCPGIDVCSDPSLCKNGGNCTDLWNEYQCDCSSRYGGRNCELFGCTLENPCPYNATCADVDIDQYECVKEATFNDTSVYFETALTGNLTEISFNLRTRQVDVSVIETFNNIHFVSIGLRNGSVAISFNLGSGNRTWLSQDENINTGDWYKIMISPLSDDTTLLNITHMETNMQTSSTFNDLLLNSTWVDLVANSGVFLGSSNVEMSQNLSLFKGCLSEVRIGGHLLPFVDSYLQENPSNTTRIIPIKPEFNTSSPIVRGCYGDGVCLPNPCLNKGECIDEWNAYTCKCSVGYAGPRCNTTLNVTCEMEPCQNNATCVNLTNVNGTMRDNGMIGYDFFSCICPDGFEGQFCHTPTNECRSDPCENGLCTDIHLNYTCTCDIGYTGRNCSINIDECLTHACLNNAMCIDGIGNYSCNCTQGFNGTHCETDIDECTALPCQNNATCNNTQGSYECLCLPGFSGQNCEVILPRCYSNPCKNNATCTSNTTHFECICQDGFKGTQCQTDTNPCLTLPCQNNATCKPRLGTCDSSSCTRLYVDYNCSCTTGFEDKNCSSPIDYCAPKPCANNATCLSKHLEGRYVCNCTEGYGNENCTGLLKYCENQPCEHNSTCIPLQDDFQCSCATGYQGKTCADLINSCDSNPCLHDGECTNEEVGFTCICTNKAWTGETCSVNNTCFPNPCFNGAECNINLSTGEYNCTCIDDFGGEHCDEKEVQLGARASTLSTASIIGIVLACLAAVLVVVILIVLTMRKSRANHGTYSPSGQEVNGARVEMNSMLKLPPEERLI